MIELRSLVEIALRQFGCHLDAREENLLHAVIPADSPMRQVLEVGDTAYLALVKIEEDRLAGLDPVRHLVPGSIYLERFIGLLTEHGTVGDITLLGVYACPDESAVHSFLRDTIREASDCTIERRDNVAHRCVTFHFIVDLFAIEASKTLVSITFDFDNSRLISNPDIGGLHGAEPAIVEIADTELKAAAATVMEKVRAEAYRQIESYADEHNDERSSARKKLQRLAKKQLDEADARPVQTVDEPLEDQRDEIARDWDQRISHADSQYKAEGAQITLVSATRQIRPFVRYDICFPARSMPEGPWQVFYDLTSGSFLLPTCQSCGSIVERLAIGEGFCTHPLCDRCAETTPACSHRACKQCVRKCCLCPGTMCRSCSFECSHDDCSLSFCAKHERLCAKCEACVCSQHRQYCRSCQRTFCNRCYRDHQWKQAGCGHWLACGSKWKVCRICKNAVCPICTERCEHCARFACNKHVVECLGCRSRVCEGCAGLDCEMCGAACCKEHSFQCQVCMRHFCYEHARWCAVCSRVMCIGDVKPCLSCQGALCLKHGRTTIEEVDVVMRCGVCERVNKTSLWPCSRCEKRVPRRLLTEHGVSGELLCIDCRLKCFGCNTWLFEFEIKQCGSCNMLLCDECLESHAGDCGPIWNSFGPTDSPPHASS